MFSNAQDLELPKELADFVFTQAPDGTVKLISLQATYVLDKKWKKTALAPPQNTKDSLALYHPKGLNDNNYISFYIERTCRYLFSISYIYVVISIKSIFYFTLQITMKIFH